jgi:hypothetical protein
VTNRQQRRQGVVYGSARPNGSGSSSSAILGRLLGLAILVVAVGLLAAGAVAFMNAPSASPTLRPTAIAALSPTPSSDALPTALPTGTALTPTLTTTPVSTGSGQPPGPSPTAPLIGVGPGFVTFGTKADSELRIKDPRTSFKMSERITWSAYLIDPVNTADVRVLVLKDDPAAPGGERLVRTDEISPQLTDAQVFVRQVRPTRLLDGPGLYTIRYIRGDRLMAEGQFLVTE